MLGATDTGTGKMENPSVTPAVSHGGFFLCSLGSPPHRRNGFFSAVVQGEPIHHQSPCSAAQEPPSASRFGFFKMKLLETLVERLWGITLCGLPPFPFIFRNNTQNAVQIIQPYCYFGTHALALSHCVCMFTYVCACMCVFMCVYVRSCLCVTVLLKVKEQPFCCSSGSVYLDFETVSMTGHPLISNNHLIPAPWR